MTQTALPDYYEIEALLASNHSLVTPSQLDGVLCGILSSGMSFENKNWLALVLDYMRIDEADKLVDAVMKALYQRTAERLSAQDFSFCLLMPDEDEPLAMRAQELGHWCEGFLAGDILGKEDGRKTENQLVSEFMQDLLDIANVEFDENEETEDNLEKAYFELVEFVRMGVQNVFSEQSKIALEPDDFQEVH